MVIFLKNGILVVMIKLGNDVSDGIIFFEKTTTKGQYTFLQNHLPEHLEPLAEWPRGPCLQIGGYICRQQEPTACFPVSLKWHHKSHGLYMLASSFRIPICLSISAKPSHKLQFLVLILSLSLFFLKNTDCTT